MRATKNSPRRWGGLVLALLLALGLAPLAAPPVHAQQTQPRTMANLVVFVKMQGDADDPLNTLDSDAITTLGEKILIDYDASSYAVDNSFSAYMKTISGGQLTVQNIFLQAASGQINGGTHTVITPLELSKTQYTDDDDMVTEVIAWLGQNAQLLQDKQLDYDGDGCLDNLTLIVQGKSINGRDHSFKRDYAGQGMIGGKYVRCYNAMPTASLGGHAGLIAHEFLHTLGLPDLYRENDSSVVPVGQWDVMAAPRPIAQYPLGYQRAQLGWLGEGQTAEITQSGTYTLTAANGTGDGVKLFTLKTPLPQADNEVLCLEYRNTGTYGFDHNSAYESGLLMYRVNNSVPDHTNFKGKNYIYVYRPGITELDGNGGENAISNAALTAQDGSFGSTDLAAVPTSGTLYYADGTNSGVKLSGVQISADGNTLTFTAEFADYGDDWQLLGSAAATDAQGDPQLYAAADSSLYLCYRTTGGQARVLRWMAQENSWQQVGTDVPCKFAPSVTIYNGTLYLAYVGEDDCPYYVSSNGGSWGAPQRLADTAPLTTLQWVTGEGAPCLVYQEAAGTGQKKLVIQSLAGDLKVERGIIDTDFCNPNVVRQGNTLYLAYALFGAKSPAVIDAYDLTGQSWRNVFRYDARLKSANVNLLQMAGEKLYAFAGVSGQTPTLANWDGSAWRQADIPQLTNYYQVSLAVAGQTVYLAYLDNVTKTAGLLRQTTQGFVPCYSGLNGAADYLQAVAVGDTVYIVSQSGSSLFVRRQQVTTDPSQPTDPVQPEDPAAKLLLRLTPPASQTAGLQTDGVIHLDGVAHTATPQGDGYTLQLQNTAAQTAVMYYYNQSGAPKGMAVWRLQYPQGRCIATLLTGLQDLISYHGFSIRVQGVSGLRFKSGLDTALRARLLGDGVDGMRLVECGTLSMSGSRQQAGEPFVKGGEKVNCGRAYWVENGRVNDHIFETVAGRHRFTSVLTNLPPSAYNTAIAFRGYVILQTADGQQLAIYGPPVRRSIYDVAKQVMAAGEFKPGSSAYRYVQGIIDAVEKGGS